MQQFELIAETREQKGKGASRRLRREDKVPAVLYGAGKDPEMLALDHKDLMQHLEHEAFYSHVLSIQIGNTAQKAVLKDLQRHPYKPRVIHLDLQRISDKEKIRMHVPLHFVNAEKSPAVRVAKGIVTHMMTNVEVACLARDLPEYIEVDLSELKEGQTVHLSEVTPPKGVEFPVLLAGHDQAVASVHIPRGAAEQEAGGEAAS